MEGRLKLAEIRAESLEQECNTLRSKLVVVDTGNFTSEWPEAELDHEENINQPDHALTQPAHAIKNSPDSTHFHLMKAYVLSTKQKLNSALLDKK